MLWDRRLMVIIDLQFKTGKRIKIKEKLIYKEQDKEEIEEILSYIKNVFSYDEQFVTYGVFDYSKKLKDFITVVHGINMREVLYFRVGVR